MSVIYDVWCYTCDHEWSVNRNRIRIDLEDGYEGFSHTYLTHCPKCDTLRSVEIESNHTCCWDDQLQ
jgi:hypothetical protein